MPKVNTVVNIITMAGTTISVPTEEDWTKVSAEVRNCKSGLVKIKALDPQNPATEVDFYINPACVAIIAVEKQSVIEAPPKLLTKLQ